MGKALRRTFWVVAAAAALAIAAPFLVPVSHFIPELSLFVSDKLGQPVTMEDLRLHLLPTPRVVGRRIAVGRKAKVRIGELEIVPDLPSLIFGPRRVRLIRANRVNVEENALAMPRAMPKRRPGEPLLVRRVVLNTVKLQHPKFDVPLFDVDVRLAEGLRLREARFETHDGRVKLRVEPSGAEGIALVLDAKNWTLPLGAPLAFDTLAARATLKRDELKLSRVEGALYGGRLVGSAQAEWGQEWQLVGKAELAGVDLLALQKALGKPGRLSGRLNADAAFSTSAKTPAELLAALTLEGPFEILGGVYEGVDLSRAAEIGAAPSAGDATTFEELRGKIQLHGERVRLAPLCMRSPKLVAGGNVEIAPDNSLSGRLDISVAQTGGIVGVPVALGGTTTEPTMRPTKGTLIGAAIGTVLLPGIGTSIGSQLGGKIEGGADCT